ncbi:MAG: VapE family protein [Bacteroidales bacterium]|nr:VapE family protein [Bacteroidales bacterium]
MQITAINQKSYAVMTENQSALLEIEAFLADNYELRRNVLSGKTEVRRIKANEGSEEQPWKILTQTEANSIVLHAKREGVGGKKSPKTTIMEYIGSAEVPEFNPISEYLDSLPVWNGQDHVHALFSRIPGLSEKKHDWLHTWLLSCVAHWRQLDKQHGNETVPILISERHGRGKTTFANNILPEHLQVYYLDHINFGNKFDSEMALTHNLLVNIDEFDNFGPSHQAKLKQTLSKVKVNGRPIFGRAQEDRPRYASFIGTTNNLHPLCDGTGSRRYICVHVPGDAMIDYKTKIDYDQLYAQLCHELNEGRRYWFDETEIDQIEEANRPFYKVTDLDGMLFSCFRLPQSDEKGQWLKGSEIVETIAKRYPEIVVNRKFQIDLGKALRLAGCEMKHTKQGQAYQLVPILAA